MSLFQEPILNIHDLTQIHSDMNLPVPDPILLTNSHDGLDGVSVLCFSLDSEAIGSLFSVLYFLVSSNMSRRETAGFGSRNGGSYRPDDWSTPLSNPDFHL